MIESQHSRSVYARFTMAFTIAVALTLIVLPSTYFQLSTYVQTINPKPLETFTASELV